PVDLNQVLADNLAGRCRRPTNLCRASARGLSMNIGKISYALLAPAIFLGWGANNVSADDAPKGNKGFTASKTTVVELGPEIEGMAGRQLRMRMLTIEPGGYIGIHSHKDRPAVVYVMQGSD